MFVQNSINILTNNTITKRLFLSLANSKDVKQFDLLYGVNPVQAALHANKRQMLSLILSDSQHIDLSSRVTKLIHLARSREIPVVFTPKQKMSRIVEYQPHQNIILKCSFLKLQLWNPQQPIPNGISVYCDKITDPQNFGAILRSCLFFGATNVFTGKKNHCPLNSTVSKASAGAMELIKIYGVTNSTDFIQKWKQQSGVVVATGIDQAKNIIPAHQIKQVLNKQGKNKILLVLGSQGFGVSSHILNLSNYLVQIQRKGSNQQLYQVVDSLNVSAAAASLLFQLTR